MKIIIIGAGIAGLTLAAACQRVGIQVKLYDKATQLRHMGGGVLLWPESRRYLEWLGLGNCLEKYAVLVERCRILDTRGQVVCTKAYAPFYEIINGDILPIDRALLQQTLLSALTNTLMLGKKCVDIKQTSHEARVLFADGTKECADLVVGADGIHSTVRQYVHPQSLQYTDLCWWGGIVDQKDVPFLTPHEVMIAMGVGKMCIVWPLCNQQFMWYLPVKMRADQLAADGVQQLKEICADWVPEVQQIISAPSRSERFHLPIYTLPPQFAWSASRVTLLGDAAHALGPVIGQGASQAIEDAFVLTNCLKNAADIPNALAQYEQLRHGKAERLFTLENESAAAMIHDDQASLDAFLQTLSEVDFLTLYQMLIPLVNERFSRTLASVVGCAEEVV